MAVTLADLKTRVNDRRRDTTNSFVTADETTRYLNEGLRYLQLQNDWDFTQTSANISYVDGTNNYTVSAIGGNDFKEPINLFYTYGYKFSFMSPEDFDVLKNYSYNIYAADGSILRIQTTFGTATLVFDYYSTFMAKTSGGSWQAEFSANTDEPLVPQLYADILVDYALMRIFQKEGKTDDYTISKNDFEFKLDRLKRNYKSKAVRTLIRMRNPREAQITKLDAREDPLRQVS